MMVLCVCEERHEVVAVESGIPVIVCPYHSLGEEAYLGNLTTGEVVKITGLNVPTYAGIKRWLRP